MSFYLKILISGANAPSPKELTKRQTLFEGKRMIARIVEETIPVSGFGVECGVELTPIVDYPCVQEADFVIVTFHVEFYGVNTIVEVLQESKEIIL